MAIVFVSFTLQMTSYGALGVYPFIYICLWNGAWQLNLYYLFCADIAYSLLMFSGDMHVLWQQNSGLIPSRATSAEFKWGKGIEKQIHKGHGHWDGKYCFFHATPKPEIETEEALTKLDSGSWQLTVTACFLLSCKWTRLPTYFKSMN